MVVDYWIQLPVSRIPDLSDPDTSTGSSQGPCVKWVMERAKGGHQEAEEKDTLKEIKVLFKNRIIRVPLSMLSHPRGNRIQTRE